MNEPQVVDVPAQIVRELAFEAAWLGWPGMHGGYVLAQSVGLAEDLARGLPLRAVNARFLRAIEPGGVVGEAVLEHRSATTATVSVRLRQDDELAAISTCTFAAPSGSLTFDGRPAPSAPAPDDLASYRDAELLYPVARQIDIRPATPTLPLSGAATAELTAWLRIRSMACDVDPLLVLADALPPGIYATLSVPVPVPSMELTVHVMASYETRQAASWLLAQQRNVSTCSGLAFDECDIWDEAGNLIAQTRQLRRVIETTTINPKEPA